MYTRQLINFFYSRATQQTEPLPSAASSVEAEFDWPPSAEDLKDYSVVHLRADDGSEIQPVVIGLSDVA
jgi:hypothetical protein